MVNYSDRERSKSPSEPKFTRVANAKLVDDKGFVVFSLWGDDIQKVSNGTKIRIIGGFTTRFNGVVYLNKGSKGTMEILQR